MAHRAVPVLGGGFMLAAPPTFTLEQAFANDVSGGTIWIGHGSYPSLKVAKEIAAQRDHPCRIIASRIVWVSKDAPI